jgi:hypothetical protein
MRVSHTEVLGRPKRWPPITTLKRNLPRRIECARASHASTRLERSAHLASIWNGK